jgi:telomerase reverse transcriptase
VLNIIGLPLGDLQTLPEKEEKTPVSAPGLSCGKRTVVPPTAHNPSSINFVRSRMLYARAALNAQGGVRFGLRHIRKFARKYQGR